MTRVGSVLIWLAVATAAEAQTHVVIISGLGGEPRFSEAFTRWSTALRTAAIDRLGVPESSVTYLAERAGGAATDRATKEAVTRTIEDLAVRARPNDQILIVLIGHGSASGGDAKFNLPGPDMTAADFANLLDLFPTQRVALVNAASASGGFIGPLSGPNRTIVTATRNDAERLETKFGGHFVRAFAEDVADVDKDERVSILEAFLYAKREVEREYDDENRMLTEHALLDDNGDGEGSLEPDPASTDGALARGFFITAGDAAPDAPSDPRLAELYETRRSLEDSVAALRARKDRTDPAEYERELERLLLELARTTRAIRQHEGANP